MPPPPPRPRRQGHQPRASGFRQHLGTGGTGALVGSITTARSSPDGSVGWRAMISACGGPRYRPPGRRRRHHIHPRRKPLPPGALDGDHRHVGPARCSLRSRHHRGGEPCQGPLSAEIVLRQQAVAPASPIGHGDGEAGLLLQDRAGDDGGTTPRQGGRRLQPAGAAICGSARPAGRPEHGGIGAGLAAPHLGDDGGAFIQQAGADPGPHGQFRRAAPPAVEARPLRPQRCRRNTPASARAHGSEKDQCRWIMPVPPCQPVHPASPVSRARISRIFKTRAPAPSQAPRPPRTCPMGNVPVHHGGDSAPARRPARMGKGAPPHSRRGEKME